jgi:hypothetical protein
MSLYSFFVRRSGGIHQQCAPSIAKNGKGWGMFTPKGMMKGGIFGEEYLKFRHFIQNNSLLT